MARGRLLAAVAFLAAFALLSLALQPDCDVAPAPRPAPAAAAAAARRPTLPFADVPVTDSQSPDTGRAKRRRPTRASGVDGYEFPFEDVSLLLPAPTVQAPQTPPQHAPALLPLTSSDVCEPLDPALVVYNRMPKCASQSMLELQRKLRTVMYLHSNAYNPAATRPADVGPFLRVLETWNRRTVYDRHMHHVYDTNAVYINVIREPVSRTVSLYNYRRFSPSRPQALVERERERWGDLSLDECAARPYDQWGTCGLRFGSMVEWLCGYAPACSEPGPAPLEQAKANIRSSYAVVGVMERLPESLELLERRLPAFFRGALDAHRAMAADRAHKNKTPYPPPSEATKERLAAHPLLRRDRELYDWVDERLTEMLGTSCAD